ncbi:MAG TPA: hypothetical protein VI520_04220 [Anaerolineales bacterium]|nr:hypothetical protein [Anaerolineales bacterium]
MEVSQSIRRQAVWVVFIGAFLALLPSAFAQEDAELRLTVRRTFGYRGGDAIQGRFSLEVEGPAELVQVTFVIDGETMARDLEPPFEHSFHTSEYPLGTHRLLAIGNLASGRELSSAERSFEFVSAEASRDAAGRIVGPLLLSVLGLIALGVLAPALLIRKRGFRLREDNYAGGRPEFEAGPDRIRRLIEESRFES